MHDPLQPVEHAGLPPSLLSLQAPDVTDATLDAALDARRTPIVDGASCVFWFRGDADSVAVDHRVMGMQLPLPLHRLSGTSWWYVTVDVPHGARIEYRLLVTRAGSTEHILDPRNDRVARGPLSENSVLEADGYITPDWALQDSSVPQGAISEVHMQSRALRRQVRVTIYAPAAVRPSRRYPLLVVHDGGDFLEYACLGTVLDNLMHRRLMAPAFVALLHPKDRMREYAANPAHGRFVTTELLTNLDETLPIRDDGDGRVLLGASLGAVASLAAAVRAPGRFGGLLLVSGSFRTDMAGWPGGPRAIEQTTRYLSSLQRRPRRVARRIFQTYGRFEPLAEPNRAITPMLRGMTDDIRIFEALDGHSWINWRDRLGDALGWLLPPQMAENFERLGERRAS
ncbi:MAG: enterochelin esterase [Candidatus Dormibacteraeota bacterium]|nr:enterochelin esterase [Candidatus Dormibacteraeota bacterium]